MTRLQQYALELWKCGLNTREIAFALNWTESETQVFKNSHKHLNPSLKVTMQLTPHFSLDEFVATQHRNIDNSLPQGLMSNAIVVCNMLERIRSYLSIQKGRPVAITITSGYRCKALNDAVGSSDSSDHRQALAVDWNARSFGTPYEVCMALKTQVDNLDIGQLIHEYGRWIHTSIAIPKKQVNRIITISSAGTVVGIEKV